jgi:hypothetical protein
MNRFIGRWLDIKSFFDPTKIYQKELTLDATLLFSSTSQIGPSVNFPTNAGPLVSWVQSNHCRIIFFLFYLSSALFHAVTHHRITNTSYLRRFMKQEGEFTEALSGYYTSNPNNQPTDKILLCHCQGLLLWCHPTTMLGCVCARPIVKLQSWQRNDHGC